MGAKGSKASLESDKRQISDKKRRHVFSSTSAPDAPAPPGFKDVQFPVAPGADSAINALAQV